MVCGRIQWRSKFAAHLLKSRPVLKSSCQPSCLLIWRFCPTYCEALTLLERQHVSFGFCCSVAFPSGFIIFITPAVVEMVFRSYVTFWQKTLQIAPPCIILFLFNANLHKQQGDQCCNNVNTIAHPRRCACYWNPYCQINAIWCFSKRFLKVIENVIVFWRKSLPSHDEILICKRSLNGTSFYNS